MLFKISHSAKHKDSPPGSAAVQLHPQFEADDEAGARAKHAKWLDDTGYALLEGVELLVELLSDEGFDPDVQEVLTLKDQVAALTAQLAAAGDAPAQVAALTAQLKTAADVLAGVTADRDDLQQTIADKDSQIATLKAQLEEALAPAAPPPVSPPPTEPTAPAASSGPPADGSTPAP